MNLRVPGETRTGHCSVLALHMIVLELEETRTHHCPPLAGRIVLVELGDFRTLQSPLASLVCIGKVWVSYKKVFSF